MQRIKFEYFFFIVITSYNNTEMHDDWSIFLMLSIAGTVSFVADLTNVIYVFSNYNNISFGAMCILSIVMSVFFINIFVAMVYNDKVTFLIALCIIASSSSLAIHLIFLVV